MVRTVGGPGTGRIGLVTVEIRLAMSDGIKASGTSYRS